MCNRVDFSDSLFLDLSSTTATIPNPFTTLAHQLATDVHGDQAKIAPDHRDKFVDQGSQSAKPIARKVIISK